MKPDEISLACGLRSNIPRCCVEWWVANHSKWTYGDKDKYNSRIPQWVGYIPCPTCLQQKRFRRVIECTGRYAKECRIDYICYHKRRDENLST